MSGNSFWLERKYWALFSEYEQKLEEVVRTLKIVVQCSYSLHRCSVRDVLKSSGTTTSRSLVRHGWQIAKASEAGG